jgi:hypothetical protein
LYNEIFFSSDINCYGFSGSFNSRNKLIIKIVFIEQ